MAPLKKIWSTIFGRAVFSAHDEQRLLLEHFGGQLDGRFLDIGANTPDSAVSQPFLRSGWTGLAVEPIPRNVELLRQAGYQVVEAAVVDEERAKQREIELHLAGGLFGRKSSTSREKIDPNQSVDGTLKVPTKTLGELINQHYKTLDLLSIDVEGEELAVISTLPSSPVPKLILIEDWALNTDLDSVLRAKKLKRVRRTGYNSWYVHHSHEFPVSLLGRVHLYLKLNLFCRVRQYRRRKRASRHGR